MHALRTTIDQRGKQTIKRDAKVAGDIKKVSTCEETVLQCCLNRNAQAENAVALEDLWSTGIDSGIYKPVKPSQIMGSEEPASNAAWGSC